MENKSPRAKHAARDAACPRTSMAPKTDLHGLRIEVYEKQHTLSEFRRGLKHYQMQPPEIEESFRWIRQEPRRIRRCLNMLTGAVQRRKTTLISQFHRALAITSALPTPIPRFFARAAVAPRLRGPAPAPVRRAQFAMLLCGPISGREPLQSKNYIICSTQRSGSSMLCHLLRQTKLMGKPGEFLALRKLEAQIFHPTQEAILEHCLKLMDENRTANGISGVKLHYHQFEQLCRTLPLSDLCFQHWIVIRRNDPILQAVSLAKAWQTRAFSTKHTAVGELSYSFELIRRAHGRIEAESRSWVDYYEEHNIKPMCLWYEKILANPVAEIQRVVNEVGISDVVHVDINRIQYKVQRDAISLDWAARYKEELESLRETANV
jgi:trehalose 2-sulfotransferase